MLPGAMLGACCGGCTPGMWCGCDVGRNGAPGRGGGRGFEHKQDDRVGVGKHGSNMHGSIVCVGWWGEGRKQGS